MGTFGKLSYSDGRWSTGGPTAVPFLIVDVHDSHIATVDYRSADATGGRFFLGYEPRIYFEEPDAGAPVDTAAEGEGFTRWARDAVGTEVDPGDVRRLMASPRRGTARGRRGRGHRRAAVRPRRSPGAGVADRRGRATRVAVN